MVSYTEALNINSRTFKVDSSSIIFYEYKVSDVSVYNLFILESVEIKCNFYISAKVILRSCIATTLNLTYFNSSVLLDIGGKAASKPWYLSLSVELFSLLLCKSRSF